MIRFSLKEIQLTDKYDTPGRFDALYTDFFRNFKPILLSKPIILPFFVNYLAKRIKVVVKNYNKIK